MDQPVRDSTPNHRPTPPPASEAFVVIGVGLLLIAGLLVWILLRPEKQGTRRTISDSGAPGGNATGPYVGSRACRECHPGEYAFYTRSGHARTMHTAAETSLARRLDRQSVTDPEQPDVRWSYALRDGHFFVDRAEDGKNDRLDLEYAFGSDHHATTFVSVTDLEKPTAREHRLTHFAHDDSLGITPGQRAASPAHGTTPLGRELTPEETLKCFGCHATRTSSNGERSLDSSTMIANVSCERCHGPARSHLNAARAGRTDLTMPYGAAQWTAESQLWLCGQCHRHPSKATPGQIQPGDRALARFQPVGLQQSRCFTRSAGGLSCVTCHDPHARASPDRAGYEPSCLKCHDSAPHTVCRVSPRSGCIDCHMPRVDSGQRVLFTDHWIRVRPETQPQNGSGTAQPRPDPPTRSEQPPP